MSQDQTHILDILQAGRLIQSFIKGMNKQSFIEDPKTQSAVLHQILILGEATKRLSSEFRAKHQEIPWRLMAGMRDVVIHSYESVDLNEIWKTASEDIPRLIDNVKRYIPNQG